MSTYPGAIDTSFPGYPYLDGVEYVLGAYANSWVLALQAIENTIGAGTGSSAANPLYSSAYNVLFTTITARIAAVEVAAQATLALDTSPGDIQPVGVSAVGNSGKAADGKHSHAGVHSVNGQQGDVTIGAGAITGLFTSKGQMFVGTGAGTGEVLNPGPTNSVLQVGGADQSGLRWTSGIWAAGDYKFTAATSWDTTQWILADGTSYPTGTYPALFAAIGYTYGGGGANFNVPDHRGRMPVGAGGPGGNGQPNFAVGSTGGEQNHSLALAENGQHSHADAGHTHGTPLLLVQTSGASNNGPWLIAGNGSQFPGGLSVQAGAGLGILTGFANIQTSGSGAPHNNEPPFLAGNWLIHI